MEAAPWERNGEALSATEADTNATRTVRGLSRVNLRGKAVDFVHISAICLPDFRAR
jgi:hypothetical protein